MCLAPEPLVEGAVLHEVRTQNLDRDLAVQTQILALVHLGHAAAPDLLTQLVALCEAALGATIPALFLWGGGWLYLKIRHREGLGLGDVKLMVMIGAFLGLQATLQTLLVGSLSGSVISLLYIWISKKDASTYELPFGTFLAGAALVIAMVG